MDLRRWLPTILRARPERPLSFRYVAATTRIPAEHPRIIAEALAAAGADATTRSGSSWRSILPCRTLVYGLIRREVDESVELVVLAPDDRHGFGLRVECDPLATHNAHAAGAAGVIALAVTVWLVAGWFDGVLPALTTALAGGLWTDSCRLLALERLERRLRRLTADVGGAVWPDAPGEVRPPPRSLGRI